jgi:hypothetical protein
LHVPLPGYRQLEWVGQQAANETRMDLSSRSWRKLHLGKKSTSLKHQYRREFVPPIQIQNRHKHLSAIQYLRVLSVLVDPEPHEPVVQYSSSLWLAANDTKRGPHGSPIVLPVTLGTMI